MDRFILCYDMTDIYDSTFVQKQVPSLSRTAEVRELKNNYKTKTQKVLEDVTGLTVDASEWTSCIYYDDGEGILGFMLLLETDDRTRLIRDVYVGRGAQQSDVFLALLSRVVRNTELGSGMGNQLYIEFTDSNMYYMCMNYLGEGTEFS